MVEGPPLPSALFPSPVPTPSPLACFHPDGPSPPPPPPPPPGAVPASSMARSTSRRHSDWSSTPRPTLRAPARLQQGSSKAPARLLPGSGGPSRVLAGLQQCSCRVPAGLLLGSSTAPAWLQHGSSRVHRAPAELHVGCRWAFRAPGGRSRLQPIQAPAKLQSSFSQAPVVLQPSSRRAPVKP
ncbi:hypothetical protein FOCC_FOCC017266 [Frankliniella occidentalis]|nr:hypothetical protein FOCC_FOCC017266 [Frankliniella occidentalis]